MLFDLPKPVIFAHRGASAHAPENTLSSFLLAVEHGSPAVELDVQLTADDQVVVFHDLDLDRTTDGTGILSNYDLDHLQKFNIEGVNKNTYPDEKIPTLAEVLSALPDHILINIELKNILFPFDILPKQTAKIINDFNAQERILISSFNPKALEKFHAAAPDIPRGRLLHNIGMIKLGQFFPAMFSEFQSLHLPHEAISNRLVRRYQNQDLLVFTYTVNHPQDILNAVECGVDGFFTDDPALAARVLNRAAAP